MKQLFVIIIVFLLAFQVKGQDDYIKNLNKDSLTNYLVENWRFRLGDDPAYASPAFNDSDWEVRDPALPLRFSKENAFTFDSIGWFRLHIYIDSGLAGTPLALRMKHLGASELYIDGKKTEYYGTIRDRKNSRYYNPNKIPIGIILSPGAHLIAVRYANYNALSNHKLYHADNAGFTMDIGEANEFILTDHFGGIILNTLTIFTFTFFFAFFLVHFFLFLYNKKDRANLFFSIFSLSFALLFCSFYLKSSINLPFTTLSANHLLFVSFLAIFLSLSGFINELFAKSRTRFTIMTALCLLSLVTWIFYYRLGIVVAIFVVGIICAEVVVLISKAIYRRVKGAMIVGIGILVFTATLLSAIIIAISNDGLSIDDSTTQGQLIEAAMVLVILSIPVTMSMYLAKNYAGINKDLTRQLKQIEDLSAKTLEQELEKQRMLENRQEELEREVQQRTSELASQKQKSDDLLRNILPEEIAEELKEKGTSAARYFDHVSVLFTDFVDFTKAGERMTPQELVDELHTCFKAFDEISSKYNIEKIKTIGDAYLAVCGLPIADPNHAANTAKAAIEIRNFISERKAALPDRSFNIRIGIHSGAVVAGIVGVKKFAYDIWGDTVNTAARMEQSGEAGKINISQSTYELIKDRFSCTFRGQITAKNKGEMNMYFVEEEIG